mgnify:CR=1 FL=1
MPPLRFKDSSSVVQRQVGMNDSNQVVIYAADGTTAKINLEKPLPVSAVVALPDAAATPTAAQICNSKIFTIAASAARDFTLPTATSILLAVPGYVVGNAWDVTIVNTGAAAVTVVGNTGTTIGGSVTVAATSSATFRVFISSSSTVVFYRK